MCRQVFAMISLLFIFACSFVTHATTTSIFEKQDTSLHRIRNLRAASNLNTLQRRADDFELYRSAALAYVDGECTSRPQCFSSIVLMSTQEITQVVQLSRLLSTLKAQDQSSCLKTSSTCLMAYSADGLTQDLLPLTSSLFLSKSVMQLHRHGKTLRTSALSRHIRGAMNKAKGRSIGKGID
jgi:hypothetical protein